MMQTDTMRTLIYRRIDRSCQALPMDILNLQKISSGSLFFIRFLV